MCYIDTTKDLTLKGFVGDHLKQCRVRIYADADFASASDGKSTSGVFEEIYGPNTCMPLQAKSQKQGCTAHCTPEAEIVAVNLAIRTMGLPAMDFFKGMYGSDIIKCEFMEDNSATQQIIATGKNPKLRHVNRSQKVNVKWLHDVFSMEKDKLFMTSCPTKDMKADIFTKSFPVARNWIHACKLIGIEIPDNIAKLGSQEDNSGRPAIHNSKLTAYMGGVASMSLSSVHLRDGSMIQRHGTECCRWCCPRNMIVVRY
jgi:hypothetical protein